VTGDGGLGHLEQRLEVAGAELADLEGFEDPQPGRLPGGLQGRRRCGEGFRDLIYAHGYIRVQGCG